MKWYNSLIQKIENCGNNIFLFDLDCLLEDNNFMKDLSLKYEIYKYEQDRDYFYFESKNSLKPKLIYSKFKVERKAFKNIFTISIKDVFPNLNLNILKNMDVCYFQKIFDYCDELKNYDNSISPENTQNIIFQSIWGIDLGRLYDPTNNLKIALEFLINKKEFDSFIINILSNNLNINLRELSENKKKLDIWIESLLLNYISENQYNHQFDLSDSIIQYYLSKVNLKSETISENINANLLDKYPWLINFKLKSSSDKYVKSKLYAEVSLLDLLFNKIFKDDFIDLNDLDDIFNLCNKFFNIIYKIQIKNLSFDEFNMNYYYIKFNNLFKLIIEENIYEQLFNFPYNNKPFTVDRILDFISYNFGGEKIALIVLDGMSFDEWFILKKYLDSFKIKELESFSILPSITSFSRTSIFSGKTPNHFLDSNNKIKYNAEREGFFSYFKEKNLSENDILFGKVDLNNNYIKTKNEKLDFKYLQGYSVIGLVCNLFDDEAHSMKIYGENKSNLYKHIDSAINSSNLIKLFEILKGNGYKIVLTSDHGNIYCEGNKINSNKMLEFDRESSRCLIFDNELFANKIVEENPKDCFKFNYNILSKDLFLVFAVNGFFGNGFSITHGSFMPEECIVPVVVLE